MNWKLEIARLAKIKEELASLDTHRLWRWHLPRVAANEEELSECERILGFKLDQEYRTFLSFANGWPGFVQNVDLLGTDDLIGSANMKRARELVSYLEPNVLEAADVSQPSVLPIAVSTTEIDVFVMPTANASRTGQVIWLAGYEIDRYPSFSDFYLAMVAYNLREIERLKNPRQGRNP